MRVQRVSWSESGGGWWKPRRIEMTMRFNRLRRGYDRAAPAAQPPLAPPMGELSSECETERAHAVASLHIGAVIATRYPLSHGFQPCQLSHRESQGAAAPPSAPKFLPR